MTEPTYNPPGETCWASCLKENFTSSSYGEGLETGRMAPRQPLTRQEWHRVMKSGCKILEHQNHDAAALLRAIALDAVIAWRIMLLALLGRTVPGLPCEVLFNPCECEVLELLASKKTLPG
jgi:hypothetical protein